MSSGTKILLAVVTLFVGTLVIYYGFVMPSDEPASPPEEMMDETRAESTLEEAAGTLDTERGTETALPVALDADLALRLPDRTPLDESLEFDPPPVLPTATPRTPEPEELPEASRAAATSEPKPLGAERISTPTPAPVPERERRIAVAPKYTPYTVQDGDTMTSIAESWFGDHRKWDLIAKANLVDPNRLRIGQVLRLPPKDAVRPAVDRPSGADRVVHTVGPGDTLSSIAVAHYGDIAEWERIYRANRQTIGASPDELRVGMKLSIPALAKRTTSAAPGQ